MDQEQLQLFVTPEVNNLPFGTLRDLNMGSIQV